MSSPGPGSQSDPIVAAGGGKAGGGAVYELLAAPERFLKIAEKLAAGDGTEQSMAIAACCVACEIANRRHLQANRASGSPRSKKRIKTANKRVTKDKYKEIARTKYWNDFQKVNKSRDSVIHDGRIIEKPELELALKVTKEILDELT